MAIATIRIAIADPALVWERAVQSYIADGNAESDVAERFGSIAEPRLAQCVTEICAEADHGGLFDFLD